MCKTSHRVRANLNTILTLSLCLSGTLPHLFHSSLSISPWSLALNSLHCVLILFVVHYISDK